MNKLFFKTWSHEMAYVLGFFAADGSMYVNPRGGHYFAFYSNDREIIEKIKSTQSSEHKIGERRISKGSPNLRYTLQIGSRKIYGDLLKLGMTRNKSKTMQFPYVPANYLKDFVRGYFDGDGNILFRKYPRKDRENLKTHFATKFISGSKIFLEGLRCVAIDNFGMGSGSLFKGDRSFVLSYGIKDSKRLCDAMYENVNNELYLERKYLIYREAVNNMGW